MLRKMMTKTGIISVITVLLLFGVLSAGSVLASSPEADPSVAETEVAEEDLDDVEEELEEENEDEDDEDDADGVDNQVLSISEMGHF